MAGTTEQYYLKNIGIYDFESTEWVWYVHGNDRIAKVTPNEGQQPKNIASTSPSILNNEVHSSFYLYDHLGNTRIVYKPYTQCPSFGIDSLEYVADYMPYGKILRSSIYSETERFLTTQHERDIETGLDYRGARFYDSDVARFLSLDPHASNYHSLSDYSYVAGNPTIFIDADGKDIIIYYVSQEKDLETGEIIEVKNSYHYGSSWQPIPDNKFVQETIKALDHMIENEVGFIKDSDVNVISFLKDSKHNATITEGEDYKDVGTTNYQVTWTPYSGSVTSDGQYQSPMLVLLHELTHALGYHYDFERYENRINTPDDDYDDKEEKAVIENVETPAAKKLNEGTRENHEGEFYETKGPTTTEPAK